MIRKKLSKPAIALRVYAVVWCLIILQLYLQIGVGPEIAKAIIQALSQKQALIFGIGFGFPLAAVIVMTFTHERVQMGRITHRNMFRRDIGFWPFVVRSLFLTGAASVGIVVLTLRDTA